MKIRRYERPLDRLGYLRKSIGTVGMLRRLFHEILAPVYRSETAYVTLRLVDQNDPSTFDRVFEDEQGTECVVLTTSEELNAIATEILPPIQLRELQDHLQSGPDRLVIIARQNRPDQPQRRVIGFRTIVRGHFSHFYGTLEGELPSDSLMIMNNFVIPECRGHRTQRVMRATCDDYAYKHGIRRIVGAIMSHNAASFRARRHLSQRSNSFLLGPITMVSILSGLYHKTTPWSEVRRWIDHPEEAKCDPADADR